MLGLAVPMDVVSMLDHRPLQARALQAVLALPMDAPSTLDHKPVQEHALQARGHPVSMGTVSTLDHRTLWVCAPQAGSSSLPWHRLAEAATRMIEASDVTWPWGALCMLHVGSCKTGQAVTEP